MLTVPTATGPGGTITASVTEGDGYTVGTAGSASVTVIASSTGPTGPVITGPVIISPLRPQVFLGCVSCRSNLLNVCSSSSSR